MTDEIEEAKELRDDLDVTIDVMIKVKNKLNQVIHGSITEEEYVEWLNANEEMFDEVSI